MTIIWMPIRAGGSKSKKMFSLSPTSFFKFYLKRIEFEKFVFLLKKSHYVNYVKPLFTQIDSNRIL